MVVFRKAVKDNRRSWIGWSLALAAVASMYASFWPTIGNNPEMASALESYPEAIKEAFHMQDMTRPENYLGSTVFGLLVPALLAVFAISLGVKAIAGDEEAGTLDLVMAHPVGRVSLALQRLAAIVAGVFVIAGVICVAVIGLRGPAEFTTVPAANIGAICLQLALFGCFFAALAFGVGAWTGSRIAAIASAATVAVFGYLGDSFLPQIESLKWTENLSPFEWYLGAQPLRHGLDWGGIGLLVGLSAVFIALGTWRFSRRDLAV